VGSLIFSVLRFLLLIAMTANFVVNSRNGQMQPSSILTSIGFNPIDRTDRLF